MTHTHSHMLSYIITQQNFETTSMHYYFQ